MIVYIPDENITAQVVSLMAHSAVVTYMKGGQRWTVLLSDEDYIPLDDIFFDHKEDE